MRPLDPRLLRAVPGARAAVTALAGLGVLAGALAMAQAFAVTALVLAVVDSRSLTWPATALLAILLARGLTALATEVAAARSGALVSTRLRDLLLTAWLHDSAERRPEPATALTMATAGATAVEPYVARYLPALFASVVLPVFAVGTLVVVDWVSALVVVLTVPLLPVFAALIGKATQDATERRWRSSAALAGHFLDVVRGLPTLVAFGRARSQTRTIGKVSQSHRDTTMATLKIAFLSSAALELLATLSVAVVAVSVGIRLANGAMPLATGLVAILLAPEAYWPIRRVGAEFHNAADGVSALEAILPALAAPSRAEAETVALGVTRVEAVSYTHPGSTSAALAPVSATFPIGLTTVTGPSGAGKSTLLDVLAGLREPTSGRVIAPRAHLVTQTPFLTAGTLRENLLLGHQAAAAPNPADVPSHPIAGATAASTETRLRAALRDVGLDGFVAALPAGLDTALGDGGFGLSAGQRARIALARVLLDDAPLVLLDEPTAHLDDSATQTVHQVMADLARERAVVAVSHRPIPGAAYRLELTPTKGEPS